MPEQWTDSELVAAVTAYLQMLKLERAGEKYSKKSVSLALLSGPLRGRVSSDHRMQNISAVLEKMGRNRIQGYKPLANVGDRNLAKIETIIRSFDGPFACPIPRLPPVPVSGKRKLPPTGYWMFVCNRTRWDGEAFLRSGVDNLLYMVSEHNQSEMKVGDLGIIRLNSRNGTRKRSARPEGVYAIVEVIQEPTIRSDESDVHYKDSTDAKSETPRARIKILNNLVDTPVAATALPRDPDFDLIRKPLMTSSIPITQFAFNEILKESRADLLEINAERLANSTTGVMELETTSDDLDPKISERVSRVIERGSIGKKVKAARNQECQICKELRLSPLSFRKSDGSFYSEAHHVQPVHKLIPGSLGMQNIMVLCANHHRQAHFGCFEISAEDEVSWTVLLDGQIIRIDKTKI